MAILCLSSKRTRRVSSAWETIVLYPNSTKPIQDGGYGRISKKSINIGSVVFFSKRKRQKVSVCSREVYIIGFQYCGGLGTMIPYCLNSDGITATSSPLYATLTNTNKCTHKNGTSVLKPARLPSMGFRLCLGKYVLESNRKYEDLNCNSVSGPTCNLAVSSTTDSSLH
ncbi:hypothetical protein TRICI_004120 [Trichomonascus ciferrii]|uniref:Uncharacterized protein n=1 Tax=Trichomonascus ciferrii TaxID=44093 RepID=A0A642V192_9ASCO|nr:hypothetical protein TRICI_004120 [Trichomonascus ciferrii]